MDKQNIVIIDNINYNLRIPEKGIKRSFSVADTDNSGRLITGEMVRDIVGTYYNYTITFKTKYLSEQEYDDLFEKLSAPVDYHTVTVPYGQETLTFKAYVTNGDDVLRCRRDGINYWEDMSINFIAMKPERRKL